MASRAESATAAGIGEPRWLRGLLIALALLAVALLVLLPLAVVAVEALSAGGGAYLAAIAVVMLVTSFLIIFILNRIQRWAQTRALAVG